MESTKKTTLEQYSNLNDVLITLILTIISSIFLCNLHMYFMIVIVIFIFVLRIIVIKLSRKWGDLVTWLSDFTLLFLITSPILTYIFITFAELFVKTMPNFVIAQGSKGDWIGFLGSMFGGSMTMFAVLFTIKHEKKEREADRKLVKEQNRSEKVSRLMPIIIIEPILDENHAYVANRKSEDSIEFSFLVKNISENHSRNLSIKLIKFTAITQGTDRLDLLPNIDIRSDFIHILPSKGTNTVGFTLISKDIEIELNDRFKSSSIKVEIGIEIEVYDIQGLEKHLFETKLWGWLVENDDDSSKWETYVDSDGIQYRFYNKYFLNLVGFRTEIK